MSPILEKNPVQQHFEQTPIAPEVFFKVLEEARNNARQQGIGPYEVSNGTLGMQTPDPTDNSKIIEAGRKLIDNIIRS